MKDKIARILGNRVVQWVFGGGLLTLLLDATNALHTEPVQRVAAGNCDGVVKAIIAIFTGGC